VVDAPGNSQVTGISASRGGVWSGRSTTIAPGYVATDMSTWTTDTIPAETMIPVDDVVNVIDMAMTLSRNTWIPRVFMARTDSDDRRA